MKIYVPALTSQKRSGSGVVWIEDMGAKMEVVPGSMVETMKTVLRITSNRCQCIFFLSHPEVNVIAGHEILEQGIKGYPTDDKFVDLNKQMVEWQAEKNGVFGFSIGMTHPNAADFFPVPSDPYIICGGLLVCRFASCRDLF